MDIDNAVVAKLSDVLRDGIEVHRCAAAVALGRIGGTRSVGVLIEALLDEDPDVRADAASALAQIPDPRSADPLMESLLGDPCSDVKSAAIRTLTVLRHEPVVPLLRRLAVSRDPEFAWDDEELFAGGWDDWIDIQVQAIRALGALAVTDAIDDILSAFDDEMGQELTEVCLGTLARLREPGVAAIVDRLNSKDDRFRELAVKSLSAAEAHAARNALTLALSDPSPEVRLAAAHGVAAHDPNDTDLAALFDDPDPVVRAGVAVLCGSIYPGRLDTLLSDSSEKVGRAVLTVLAEKTGLLETKRILPYLTGALLAGSSETAVMAANALATAVPEMAFDVLAAAAVNDRNTDDARAAAIKAMSRLDDHRVVDAISALVADGVRAVRFQALAALARIAGVGGNDAALAHLISTIRGELVPAPEEAEEGAHVAETVPADDDILTLTSVDSSAVPDSELPPPPTSTLEAILGSDSPHLMVVKKSNAKVELSDRDLEFLGLAQRRTKKKRVDPAPRIAPHLDSRRFAARVAGDVPHQDMVEALSEQLAARDPELVLAALDSLGRVVEKLRTLPLATIDALADIVHGTDSQRRLLALHALGASDAPRALSALRVCLRDKDSFLRIEAVRSLSAHGQLEPAQTDTLLQDADPGVRLAAAEALRRVGGDEIVEKLVTFAFAFEGYHFREAANYLSDLAPRNATRLLLEILEKVDRRREWQIAIEMLAVLNESPRQSGAVPANTEQV